MRLNEEQIRSQKLVSEIKRQKVHYEIKLKDQTIWLTFLS